MASLADKIIEYLAKHPNSKAKEIAEALRFTRRSINQALYYELEPSGAVLKNLNDEWDLSDAAKNSRTEINAKKGVIEINEDAAKALMLINSGKNVFITGKAGTGKTTLLRKIRDDFQGKKVMITLAPTGVAAENAGGFTMHSFLRLPLTPYAPNYKKNDLYSLDDGTIDVVKNLDIIIIDEISMVRCDMLDATDNILRHYRDSDKPFGGIQLIMFGDLYQLMPVAEAKDWNKIKEFYETPYFFSSSVLSKMEYYICELNKVYRQKNTDYIRTLNNIRVGKITLSDINLINSRYVPENTSNRNAITLMTRNWKTKKFNNLELEKIPGNSQHYKAQAVNWHEKLPTDWDLCLKPGARVMFVRNDNLFKKYVNGTMGWVVETRPDAVYVREDKRNEVIRVEKQRWDEFSFCLDKKTKTILTEVIGSFSQIPLKLAWAVTIHKSQGLTFDEVDIDAADSFTFGQIYVALSRCRTLTGIRLLEKIPSHKVIADDKVLLYLSCIDQTGRVKQLPSFRLNKHDVDHEKDDLLCLDISTKSYDAIKKGRKDRLVRNISNNNIACQVFENNGGKLLPNKIFAYLQKEWRYDEINDGNCPFLLRKSRMMKLYCNYYNEYIICSIDDSILIQTNTSKNQWQVSIPIGTILSIHQIKNNR